MRPKSQSADRTIACCMLGFSPQTRDGIPAIEAPVDFWASQFRAVAAEGFTAVELSDGWLKPALLSRSRRAELVECAQEAGLSIPSVHIQRVSVMDPRDGEANLAYQHASIDVAAELGAEVYSTGFHRQLTPEQRSALWFWIPQGPRDNIADPDERGRAVSLVRELGEHAASVGLKLSLELYEDTFCGTADSAVNLVQDIGLTNVGLNPDVGNLIRLHRPVEDWRELYEKTLPFANYWHLKNYARDEDAVGRHYVSTPSTLRDGLINYRQVLTMADDFGYDGIFTCEHYGGDSIGTCGENRRYLKGLFDTADSARPLTDNPAAA